MKAAALALPGVSEARVALTASKPGRTFIAIGSGKGGVGKSTLAANLAIALARMGKKVGIVDADIYGPSQPTLLGTTEKPHAENDKLVPVEAQGIRLLSVGQLVSAGQALAWRGPMASGALTQLIEGRLGRHRNHPRRLAARYRRRAAVSGPEIAAGRRGDRLDPAGPVADRRDAGDRPVRQDQRSGARHHREYGRLRLPPLRGDQRPVRTRRRRSVGQAARRAFPWPSATCRQACAKRRTQADRQPRKMAQRPTHLLRLRAKCWPSWKKSAAEALMAPGGLAECR